MAPLGEHAGSLQPSRPAPDDDGPTSPGGPWNDMRHGGFPAGRGVLNTKRLSAGIDPVNTIAGAYALADVVGPPFDKLPNDVGIGDMGARHGDHVDMAIIHGACSRGDIRDARGMEDRQIGLRPNGARKIEEGRHRKRHVWHMH